MAPFAVNPNRHDPYKQFKFRVTWDGRVVAGVSKVGALRRSTEVIEHREVVIRARRENRRAAPNFSPLCWLGG
jgi:phage tail-like protein